MAECVVYWLFDEYCVDPLYHGYIGITNNVKKRMYWHRKKRKRKFEYKILFEGTRQECLEMEGTFRPELLIGWNIAQGGSDSPSILFSHSEESNIKRSKTQKGKPKHTPESIEKIRLSHLGKKHTPETISLFKEQRSYISSDTREKMRQSQLGSMDTEETKKKKSESAQLAWARRKSSV